MSISKVILVNKAASEEKYGKFGWKKIEKAIDKLIAADRERDLVSQVFEINSKMQMKTVDGKPVTQASNANQVKQAIDAIFCATQPHSLPDDSRRSRFNSVCAIKKPNKCWSKGR